MNSRKYSYIRVRNNTWCKRCRRAIAAGDKVVFLHEFTLWCPLCAEHPLSKIAKESGNCNRCGGKFKAGDHIGWAPISGICCSFCMKGKDSQRATLPEDERQILDAAMETVKRLSNLANPSDEAKAELSDNVSFLKKYVQVKAVAKLLKRLGYLD